MATALPPSILDQPLAAPPPGTKSNFVNPVSKAYEVYIAAGICLPLIVLFAVLRIYTRLKIMRRKMLWNDVIFAIGLLGGLVFYFVTLASVSGGIWGKHAWDVPVAQFDRKQIVLSLIEETIYGPCTWLIKLSLFVLYLEIFGRLRWLRILVITGITVTGIFYFSAMIIFAASCAPGSSQSGLAYLIADSTSQCQSVEANLTMALGAMNVISDLYLISLPLPAVWYLNLPFRKKMGVSAMFLTGSIACIASIIGLVYRVQNSETTDVTWAVVSVWIATYIEMAAGLLVASMPALASAFKEIKSPKSTSLGTSKHSRWLLSSSGTGRRQERIGSRSDNRPIYRLDDYQKSTDLKDNMHETWPGPNHHRGSWLLEHGRSAHDLPSPVHLTSASILKTTQFDVASEALS